MVLMKKFKFLLVAAFLMLGLSANAQFYSVKTNVLGLATGNLNLELSATASRKVFTCRLITIHSRTTLSQTIVR